MAMGTFNTSVIVRKPLDRTFPLLLCESTMPLWISGFKSIELLHGEVRQANSKYLLHVEDRGRIVKVKQDILEITDLELIRTRLEHPDVITYSDIHFEAIGQQTKISCHVKVHGKGFAVKMAMGIAKSILRSRQEKDYKRFKQVLEQAA